jgi:magnesium transporter
MEEAEQEEQEIEEVEDLLEFYLQRSTAIQTEAERLLAGARDLEESIGLALSARRFEVNRWNCSFRSAALLWPRCSRGSSA